MNTYEALTFSSVGICNFATDGTGDITVVVPHGLIAGNIVKFTTATQLPNELTAGVSYYVLSAGLTTTKLRIALTAGGTAITFSFSGSGLSCYVRTDTFDKTKVPSTQTDIPIPVSITHADLKSVANGGHVQSPSGFDIRAWADSGLSIKLYIELEYYDPVAGTLVMWVKIPSLSSSVNTVIYLTYGVASYTSDTSSTLVWTNGFMDAYHFKDGTTLNLSDSTGINAAAINHGATAVVGQIDGCASMVAASSQYVESQPRAMPTSITLSAWIKPTSFPATANMVISHEAPTGTYAGMQIDSTGKFNANALIGGSNVAIIGTTVLTAGNWYYVAMTYTGAGNAGMKGYVGTPASGAVANGSSANSGNISAGTGVAAMIGRSPRNNGSGGFNWNGLIDEPRVASVARSVDWLTVEVNSQGSPSTFQTLGTEGTGTIPAGGDGTLFKGVIYGSYGPRGTGLFLPGRTGHAPQAAFSPKAGLGETAVVGGYSFNGTVVTCTVAHGLTADTRIRFTTPIPTVISVNAFYYVLSAGLTAKTFQISATQGGTPINFGADIQWDIPLNSVPPWPQARINDVYLSMVLSQVFKSTNNAVYACNDWGWYNINQFVFAFTGSFFLTATESLTIAVTARGPTQVGASESLSLSETIATQAPQHLTATETLTIAVAPTFGGQYFRHAVQVVSSNVVDGDFMWISGFDAVATLPKMRTVAELLSIAVFPVQKIGPGLSVTESLATSDVATRQLVALRVLIESLAIADSPFTGTIQTSVRTATESLLISLSVQVGIPVTARGVSEALTLSDNVSRILQAFRGSTESLLIADSPTLTHFGFGVFAFESLLIADLATVVAGHNATASETLQIVDSVFGSLNRVRTALESLTIAEAVTFAGVWGRGLVESLLIADDPRRRVALLRRLAGLGEVLRILESPTAASGFAMTASEALRIEEWAAWITGPHDPWEYWLDLRTGNLPVESTLDTPQAEACLDTPEAESCVDTPEAESELVGNTADSGLRYIDP